MDITSLMGVIIRVPVEHNADGSLTDGGTIAVLVIGGFWLLRILLAIRNR